MFDSCRYCSRQVSEEDIISLLTGLELGDLESIKIQNCPVPVNPLSQMISAMGVVNLENIKRLIFSNVPRSSPIQLEGYHFQNLTGLQQLSLVRASLSKVSKAFFQEIPQLKSVTLTNNRISLEGDCLTDLTELVDFVCNSCYLDTIQGNLFSGLTKLKGISLHNNQISSLYPGTFDSQVALESLNLERNDLQTFPDNIFDKMENLSNLQISRNKFTTFPDYLFKFNKNFTHFELIQNGDCFPYLGCPLDRATKLTFPERMFHDSSVKAIKMLWVPSNDLSEDFFKGSKTLVNLTLQNMLLTSLPAGLFKDTESIKLIDFSANLIESLPLTLFRNLGKLESLRFIDNKIRTLDEDLFTGLRSLKIFHFNENQIRRLDSHIFANLNNLEELDLSSNNITLGDHGHFTSTNTWDKLRTLNLSGNDLDRIPNGVEIIINLVNLDLSHNKLGPVLEFGDLNNFLQNNRHGKFVISLANNLIERIDLTNPYNLDIKETKFKLNLLGNPIICDCTVTMLKTLIDGTVTGPLKNLMEISPPAVRCSEQSPPRIRRKLLNDPSLDYRDLNCPFPSSIIATPCPEPCSCSLNTFHRQTFMDCSDR